MLYRLPECERVCSGICMYYSYLVYLFRKGDNLGIKRKEVSFITDKLSIDKLYKILVFKRLTVINIIGSNHEAE